MIPIIGPIVAALGGALGIGAGGAAATGLGSLLGNAWLPALGTGIGTLLTGGSGKDALRNAAIAGGGSMLFPGVGKSVSGGISQLLGIGGQQMSGPTDMGMAARFAPPRRPEQTTASTMTAPAATGAGNGDGISAMGADIQERRRSTVPGIAALSNIPPDPRLNLGSYSPSRMPPDPRLEGLPEIPKMETIPYKSPYGEDFDLTNELSDVKTRGYGEGLVDLGIAKRASFIDPFTGIRYAKREERDAAMEKSSKGFATGGEIQGPGTGTSDSVPATIYQGGKPVKDAALSDGEFVMTAKAVRGMGNGSRERGITRMYELMRRFENGEMA